MKNIFLSVVIICALVIAGVGGTLAGFSDTEQSFDNYFEVSNMDLKVSDANGNEYDDPDVPALVFADLAWPCESRDYSFDMHNLSDSGGDGKAGYAYIKIKNIECKDVYTTKFPDSNPEPEDVAQDGGLLNQETIVIGDEEFCVADFIEIALFFDIDGDGELEPIIGNQNWKVVEDRVYLSDIKELWIPVGRIPGCNTRDGKMSLHISNWSEQQWNDRFQTNYAFFADDLPFNDWLTNLFQNDGAYFDIEFALTQDPIPASYQYTPAP